MQNVRVELGDRSYRIAIGTNILRELGGSLDQFGFSRTVALVSNPTVFRLYGETVSDSLQDAGFDLVKVIIPDGEEYKTHSSLERMYGELLTARLDRRSALVALGGGVIGDITGFAASTYMRGIAYLQVPTTLLAQVDSSVGGKTGINHALGKNMIGAFWQPGLVWIDINTLRTLPRQEFLAGLAEVIKYGVIRDEELFAFLEKNRDLVLGLDAEALTYLIRRSCEIKSEVVSKDERESGLRSVLNYGHTIGHAVETVTEYKRYLHGEAVAIGMHLEAKLSQLLGIADGEQVTRIRALLDSYGLPSALPDALDPEHLISSMQIDKKVISGEMTFILPEKIGSVRIHRGVALEDIRKIL